MRVNRSSSVSFSGSSSVSVSRSNNVVQSGDADDVLCAGLQFRDIFVLCGEPLQARGLTRGLRDSKVPLAVLDRCTATKAQLEDVGNALTDQVTLTDIDCVRGLKRRVVVGVGECVGDRAYGMSRCTGQLMWIGTPSDY